MTAMILYSAYGRRYPPMDSLSGLADVEQQDAERDFPVLRMGFRPCWRGAKHYLAAYQIAFARSLNARMVSVIFSSMDRI